MVYEIVYFDAFPGKAEVLKLIAETGSVPYVFKGINKEEWPQHKPNARYGQLPFLNVNENFTLYQTIAIARFLAQEGGLYPTDKLQAATSEEYVTSLEELLTKFVKAAWLTPEDKKAEELKLFNEGPLKTVFGVFDKVLESKDGYLIENGKLTWADLYFFDWSYLIEQNGGDISPFTNISKLRDNVKSNEKAKAYLESDRSKRKL
ncbi:hypothetical protein ABK040_016378 [Willaertia magna]